MATLGQYPGLHDNWLELSSSQALEMECGLSQALEMECGQSTPLSCLINVIYLAPADIWVCHSCFK